MALILIVDDDAGLRESLAETMRDLGHEPRLAATGEAALAILAAEHCAAVLLDLRMPGMDGLELLRRLQARPAPPPVAVLTAVPTSANTIEAMRLGAVDHLAKPVGRADLAALLARMLAITPPAPPPPPTGEEFIGASAAMRMVQKTIGRLADQETTVLIIGETGTGKEVVARAIHRYGRRGRFPFIAINCAAIPAELLESELFGHVRGAFTGAHADREGAFRAAQGGTILLDEIGDMAPLLQAKLLRVLETREVTPLGGRATPLDVRILAATHRDLRAEIAQGRFREDLYYRIGVVPIALPPLRERLADIVPLAEHFLAQSGSGKRLEPAAAARLLAHPWPGNVRELRNALERAAVLTPGPWIPAAAFDFLDMPHELDNPHEAAGTDQLSANIAAGTDLPGTIARLEMTMIQNALAATNHNRVEAARRLGIHRQLLYVKLRRYGLGETVARDAEASDKRTQDDRSADESSPSP